MIGSEKMHSYLRAIGFSNINNRLELNKLIEKIIEQPTKIRSYKRENNSAFTEITMEFSDGIGLALRGETDEMGNFHMEH